MPKLDLSMSAEEIDAFLGAQRTVRLATIGRSNIPHVVPLWFVWMNGCLYMNSTLGNETMNNLHRDPTASGVIDDGETYDDLRGVIVKGRIEWGSGERAQTINEMWSVKYLAGNPVPFERWKNRAWFSLPAGHVSSWDFRKMAEARARRAAAR
ncbi:MAG TPA: pyridoxamine 5'-phosphate oxidase family protein [Actinomycetota bacterium]|jgi:nitroimidazol reductase NimA-like FMN-containing flavoprotein (pyridoxamine 5'-phosphate oxidase superfamily)